MKINSFIQKSGIVVAASGGALLSGLMAIAGPSYPTCSFNNNGAPQGNNLGACKQIKNGKTVTWNINKACSCPGTDFPTAITKCTGGQNGQAQGAFSCQ